MHRRLRHLVAVMACAGVALALPVAVAAPTAQAADPAVHAEWRGWTAVEQVRNTNFPGEAAEHVVRRFWTADDDREGGPSVYAASHYSRASHVIKDCGNWSLEWSGEASGPVRSDPLNPYGPYRTNGGQEHHGFANGTPSIDWYPSADSNHEYITVRDFVYNCGQPQWSEYERPVSIFGLPSGGPGDFDAPPLTVTNDHSWPAGDRDERRSVVCMSRSTVDTDEDGLPDEVDLAPLEGGLPVDLGHPGGAEVWSEDIVSPFGGPDGKHGIPSCPATPQHEKQVMASLGDSYSSGEGVYGYDPKTDDPGVNHCHRANSAYARVAFRAMTAAGADLDEIQSLACSGAVAENVLDTPFCGSGCEASASKERPQLERLRELDQRADVSVDVVTLGIGGNDAGFGDVIAACMAPGGGNCVAVLDPFAGGVTPGATVLEVIERIDRLLLEVADAAPEADVVLVGYPVFISGQYDSCPSFLGGGIGAGEAEWIRGQILYMNVLLEELAAEHAAAGVRFLSLDTAYGNNVLCNGGPTDSQWVHGLIERQGDADSVPGGCPVYDTKSALKINICNESFHPKAEGHAASGQALAFCLTSDQCGTASTETVRSPAELVDGPSIDERECVIYGNPCRVEPGKSMKVRAKGFKPGSKVSVELHSRPVVLGEATADASGVVEAIVTVQPGTVTPGQHEVVLVGPGDDTIVRVGRTPVEVICASGFSDIAADDPFCGDITWMRSTGVTTGYSDGTYRPGFGLSRAQMASFLWRLAGQPVVAESAPSFADVPAESPHATAVRWLATRGITTGYPDGTFKPDLGLTRAHMAAFLHRFADQPAPRASALTFPDVPADNQFATAISWLAGEGITLGKSDGTYGPADSLTRQQMAAFLHRFGEPRGLPE